MCVGCVGCVGYIGSPPRVRGHARQPAETGGIFGITPAGAGTCDRSFPECRELQDHPRGCGDMLFLPACNDVKVGSPPRVRGHVHFISPFCFSSGITPAGAGTWGYFRSVHRTLWDHPRGCGDMVAPASLALHMMGSPPRVRGHGSSGRNARHQPGITPAGAGTCLQDTHLMRRR